MAHELPKRGVPTIEAIGGSVGILKPFEMFAKGKATWLSFMTTSRSKARSS